MDSFDVVVVGGGPAGSAIGAAEDIGSVSRVHTAVAAHDSHAAWPAGEAGRRVSDTRQWGRVDHGEVADVR